MPVELGSQFLKQLLRRAHIAAVVIDVIAGDLTVPWRFHLAMLNAERAARTRQRMAVVRQRERERFEVQKVTSGDETRVRRRRAIVRYQVRRIGVPPLREGEERVLSVVTLDTQPRAVLVIAPLAAARVAIPQSTNVNPRRYCPRPCATSTASRERSKAR